MNPGPQLTRWLQTQWYERRKPSPWLLPLSAVFASAVKLRRRWIRPVRVPVRVVIVGNLAVGGSGKTPLVAWLARELQRQGVNVGIVLRGYGGQRTDVVHVTAAVSAAEVGDEARWLADVTGVPVAVGADRVAAVRALLAETPLDIVLSDDGLQHYRLGRAAEIIAIDAHRGWGNGALLPAGPLREPVQRLEQASVIVLKGEGNPATPPGVPRVRMRYTLTHAERLSDHAMRPLAEFRGRPLRALAAIANPDGFFADLEALGLEFERVALPDHAPIAQTVAGLGSECPLLITTKDAVKLDTPLPHVWQVPLAVAFSDDDAGILLSRVRGDEKME